MAPMKVEFLDVGQGDSTFIKTPNGKAILVDCHFVGDYEDVLEHVISKLSRDDRGRPFLDCLVITHPHDDHIGGIGRLAERVVVRNIWESGHRLYIPKEEQAQYPDYYDMLDLIQAVKKRGGEVKILRANSKGMVGGLDDDVTWYCLSPSRAYSEQDRPTEEEVHAQCLVIKMEYRTNSVLFTGDSTWEAWKERIVPSYSDLLHSTILHVSHHGSITFFADSEDSELYTEHLVKISPDVSVVPVGQNSHGHPHEKAMEQYKNKTYHYNDVTTQVLRTDKLGTIASRLYADGRYTVMPLYHFSAVGGDFPCCYAEVIPEPLPDSDGTYPRGVTITFNLKVEKVRAGMEMGRVIWEVQNNGQGKDGRVHDWYFGKDSDEMRYVNHTAFYGSHNLYVRVMSRGGTTMAETVHVVKVRDEGAAEAEGSQPTAN